MEDELGIFCLGDFRASLQHYFLEDVIPTNVTLGVGSYGSVIEVKYRHVLCAAKKIHDILFQQGNEGVHEIIEKYRQECQLMAALRHPNITQFLGVCFVNGSRLPMLVMERLEMSVDDLLESVPDIPLFQKLSILSDTCAGLVYLHGMESPVVHRDLTARNVLLTSSLSAKITDLGNSRIVYFSPGEFAQTLSRNPGTSVYMPPEAVSDSHRYGPSLDVFSFGHLSLYTLTQVFPGTLLSATYTDDLGQFVARSEVDRRQMYINQLDRPCGSLRERLKALIVQCLQDIPERRPVCPDLFAILLEVKMEMVDTYGHSITKQLDINRILFMKELKEKDSRIHELEASGVRLNAENGNLASALERLQIENRQQRHALERLENERRRRQATIMELENEASRLMREREHHKTEKEKALIAKNTMEKEFDSERHQIRTELIALREQLETCNRLLAQREVPLQLNWTRISEMPFSMSIFVQSVEINGTIYVGGGDAFTVLSDYIVMVYCTQSQTWHTLPPYSARYFAVTAINDRLVLVGGEHKSRTVGQVGVWDCHGNQWNYPYPPMPTPRSSASANAYKHWLLVAGGYDMDYLSTVEVYNVNNEQWTSVTPTPRPWHRMKSVVINDAWYLLGGWYKFSGVPDVYSVSIEALISQRAPETCHDWRRLASLDSTCSCPLILRGNLFAVGGWKNGEPVPTILRYVSDTNTWISAAGELPCALYDCTCVTVSNEVYVMGGFNGCNGVSTVYKTNS